MHVDGGVPVCNLGHLLSQPRLQVENERVVMQRFPDSLFLGSRVSSVSLPLRSAHAVQNQLGLCI